MKVIATLWHALTPPERRQLAWLVPVAVLAAAFEVAGIAAIAPFLTLVGDPGAISDGGMLEWFYTRLAFDDERAFLVALGGLSLAVLIISNVVAAAATFLMQLRIEGWGRSLSTRLLQSYLRQPYTFFLRRNTSELGKNILSEVRNVVNGIISPLIQLIARGVSTLFVIALLVVLDPVLALVAMSAFAATYLLIYALARSRLNSIGQARVQANSGRFKLASEAMSVVKDLLLLRRTQHYVDSFERSADAYAGANVRYHLIAILPRYALETVAFGGVLLMVLSLLQSGRGLDHVLPIIGVYAFAAYRLMPALQAIFAAAASLRFNAPALEAVARELTSDQREDRPIDAAKSTEYHQSPLPVNASIELRNITFWYPGGREPVLKGLDLTIAARSTVGLVGPSGAGKTTVADLILGLFEPAGGTVSIDGQPLTEADLPRWQRTLGYVPQHIYLTDDTVAANIALGLPPNMVDREAVERAARTAQIHDFINAELPLGYDTVVGDRGIRLSGGQRQRIGIARALYQDPAVLVFDEATSALDGATEAGVMKAIEALKGSRTILIIAHRMTTVMACDDVALIEDGVVTASGTFTELLRSSRTFQRLAGKQHSGVVS